MTKPKMGSVGGWSSRDTGGQSHGEAFRSSERSQSAAVTTRTSWSILVVALLMVAGCNQGRDLAADGFACQSNGSEAKNVKEIVLSGQSPSIVVYGPSETLGGSTDGISPFVDPVDLIILRSGDIAVLDRGSVAVQIIRTSPDRMIKVGRLGEGPGEFGRAAHELFAIGDSSFGVVDVAHRRVVEFTTGGDYVRMDPTNFGSGPALGYGARPDRKLIRFDAVLKVSPEGRGEYSPAVQMALLGDSSDAKEFSTGVDTVRGLYSAHPVVAVEPSGSGFAIGSPDNGTVAFLDWDGTCSAVWRAVGSNERIKDSDKRFLLEQGTRKVAAPDKEAFLDKMLSSVGLADFYPRFSRLVLSRNEVWINLSVTADKLHANQYPDFDFDNTGSRDWIVVSRQGKPLRLASLPVEFKLFAITERGPIGVMRSPDGEASVELLRPRK